MTYKNYFTQRLFLYFSTWFYFQLIHLFYRFLLIISLSEKVSGETTFADFFYLSLNSFRFDSVISTYFLLLPFFVLLFTAYKPLRMIEKKLLYVFSITFIIVVSVLNIITIPFFIEYDSYFNEFLFGLVYDDINAIMATIWESYNPVFYSILSLILISSFIYAYRYLGKKSRNLSEKLYINNIYLFIIIFIISVGVLLIGARGTLGNAALGKADIGISKDEFLNKTTINPFFALKFASKSYKKILNRNTKNPYLKEKNLDEIRQSILNGKRIEEYFVMDSSKYDFEIDHVFVLLMESFDSWQLTRKYENLGLSNNAAYFLEHGQGTLHCLPASNSTFRTYASVLSGIPYSGLPVNDLLTEKRRNFFAIGDIFTALGFKTRIYYGGYLSWADIGKFSKTQGFNEVFGGAHMGSWSESTNPWGMNDERVFEFINKKTVANQKTFNIVLTTSNHPPYSIELDKRGYHYPKLPEKSTVDPEILGHLWYSDQELGNFIRRMSDKHPNSLFVITGDHFSRKFLNANPDYLQKNFVPLIFYRKSGLPKMTRDFASHHDIFPTIVDLLKIGKPIPMYGQSLYRNNGEYSYGNRHIINSEHIVNLNNLRAYSYKRLESTVRDNVVEYYDDYNALIWDYIISLSKK